MSSPETIQDSTDHGVEREGPLAHATRAAAETAYLERLDDRHREAWERASGARPERSSKRLLVALSHTIEKAVMSGPIVEPTVVIALFQKMAFFDREREVYERMAAAGIEVVIGFVDGAVHAEPEGVDVVRLDPDEPLADEWSVVAVGPDSGAFLVATDQHTFDSSERAYEASRQFDGRWGYARAQAATELARLRLAIGDRMDARVREVVDGLLRRTMPAGGQSAASTGTAGELWATTSLHHMIDAMRRAQAGTRELRDQLADAQAAAAARSSATVDPASGLPDRDFLERWYTPGGGTPLTVGLALFDVAELGNPRVSDDPRTAYHAAHQVAAALTQPLGAVDAAVRLSPREFLLVVPGASTRYLATLCDAAAEHLELASGGYPGVSLRATIAAIVTDTRPLPLGDLHEALARLAPGQTGPIDAGRTPHGERIVVASSRLHADEPAPGGDGEHRHADDRDPGRDAHHDTRHDTRHDADDVVPLPRRLRLEERPPGAPAESRPSIFSDVSPLPPVNGHGL